MQLIPAILFGYFINFYLWILREVKIPNYRLQLFLTVISIIILAFGMCLEIIDDFLIMPGEGIVLALCFRYNLLFNRTKIIFDLLLVGIAMGVSLLSTHQLIGVREGTILAVLLTGKTIGVFQNIFGNFFTK